MKRGGITQCHWRECIWKARTYTAARVSPGGRWEVPTAAACHRLRPLQVPLTPTLSRRERGTFLALSWSEKRTFRAASYFAAAGNGAQPEDRVRSCAAHFFHSASS